MTRNLVAVSEGDRITQTDEDDVHYHESLPGARRVRRRQDLTGRSVRAAKTGEVK
jgi:hypothetical protein